MQSTVIDLHYSQVVISFDDENHVSVLCDVNRFEDVIKAKSWEEIHLRVELKSKRLSARKS
jgi:hypothetical protein